MANQCILAVYCTLCFVRTEGMLEFCERAAGMMLSIPVMTVTRGLLVCGLTGYCLSGTSHLAMKGLVGAAVAKYSQVKPW